MQLSRLCICEELSFKRPSMHFAGPQHALVVYPGSIHSPGGAIAGPVVKVHFIKWTKNSSVTVRVNRSLVSLPRAAFQSRRAENAPAVAV